MAHDPMPFWKWKSEQIAKDISDGVRVYRERDWYWSAYGRYCVNYLKTKDRYVSLESEINGITLCFIANV
jgi:hypothetical protein